MQIEQILQVKSAFVMCKADAALPQSLKTSHSCRDMENKLISLMLSLASLPICFRRLYSIVHS